MKNDLGHLNGHGAASLARMTPRLALARARSVLADANEKDLMREELRDPATRRAEAASLASMPGMSDGYLREICEGAANMIGRSKVSLFVQLELDRELPPARLVNAGLVLNEMMLNALRHSHPGGVGFVIEVWVRYGADGKLEMQVTDDGVGMPEAFDPVADAGFGHTLMRTIADEMGGAVTFTSGPLGVVSRLRAPAVS